ncbi:hypothetical protein [Streptomyces sp. NEAU-174]
MSDIDRLIELQRASDAEHAKLQGLDGADSGRDRAGRHHRGCG